MITTPPCTLSNSSCLLHSSTWDRVNSNRKGRYRICNPFVYSNLDLCKNHEDHEGTAIIGVSISDVQEDVFSAGDKAQLTFNSLRNLPKILEIPMGFKGSRALRLSTWSTSLFFLNHKTYCAQEKKIQKPQTWCLEYF